MLTARVCRCGKDVTRDSLPTSLRGIVACPVCGRGVLDQDDRSRIAWRRTRKVDASLTRFVLQLHAFPMAFLALDDAGRWLEQFAEFQMRVCWCSQWFGALLLGRGPTLVWDIFACAHALDFGPSSGS